MKKTNLLITTVILSLLLACFQNCSRPMESNTAPSLGGAGTDGMRFASKDETCVDPNGFGSVIAYDRLNGATLVHDHCVDLNPGVQLTTSDFHFDPANSDYMIYKGLTYGAEAPQNRNILTVQQADNGGNWTVGTPTTTIVTSSFAATPVAGDLIVCMFMYLSTTINISNVVDSAGNNFVSLGYQPTWAGSSTAEFWYAENIKPGVANQSVTATLSGPLSQTQAAICAEYSSNGSPLTLSQSFNLSGPAPTLATTPVQIDNFPVASGTPTLIVGGVWTNTAVPDGSGFVTLSNLNNDLYVDKIVYDGSSAPLEVFLTNVWTGLFATFN